jgi:hypothetical protein
MVFVALVLRREGIEETLALTRRQQATFDPEFVHRASETEPIHEHADRADDAGLVHENLVRRGRNVIATGSTDVFHHHMQRDCRVFRAQTTHFIVDDPGLNRAAARAVDAQDHPRGVFVLESGLQGAGHILGVGVTLGLDHAAEVNQCRIFRAIGNVLAFAQIERHHQKQSKVAEAQQLEENPPAAPALLLGQRFQRQFFKHLALPVHIIAIRHLAHLPRATRPSRQFHQRQLPSAPHHDNAHSGNARYPAHTARHVWRKSSISLKH